MKINLSKTSTKTHLSSSGYRTFWKLFNANTPRDSKVNSPRHWWTSSTRFCTN
jgi:hypothetical protein